MKEMREKAQEFLKEWNHLTTLEKLTKFGEYLEEAKSPTPKEEAKTLSSNKEVEEFFKEKFGNELKASDSWVLRFAEEYANQSSTVKVSVSDEEIEKEWENRMLSNTVAGAPTPNVGFSHGAKWMREEFANKELSKVSDFQLDIEKILKTFEVHLHEEYGETLISGSIDDYLKSLPLDGKPMS